MKTTYKVPQREWIENSKKKLDQLDERLTKAELRLSSVAADVDHKVRAAAVATRTKVDDWTGRLSEAGDTAADVWDTIGTEIATTWESSRAALETGISDIEEALEGEVPAATRPTEGDTVFVHYRGRLEDGTEFQSTQGRDPIEFELGKANVVRGVEKAVRDMVIGQTKTVRVPVQEGFGPRDESLVFNISRDTIEEEIPGLGDRVTVQPEGGSPLLATVRQVKDDAVEVDANHPLAGHELHMELKLVGIS